MLYIILLMILSLWMIILLSRKRLSWHSIINIYAISVFAADMTEVTFNLLMNLYKFPTHLSTNPIFENEYGIVLGDTLILPFTFIIFVHYARKERPWRTSLPFAAGFIVLEWIFLKFGYLEYIRWNIALSGAFYIAAFRFYAHLAPRLVDYNPPISYRIRIFCFSHTFIMWVGAILSLPLLGLYQFRPGVFENIMADCRFTDLLSGDVLALLCALFIPGMLNRYKVITFTILALLGTAFALYFYYRGWLIYHNWNNILMSLRYFSALLLVFIYDRWEHGYKHRIRGFRIKY